MTRSTSGTVGTPTEYPAVATNEVRLTGRVTTSAAEKELPSGDRIVTFRISVRRPPARSAGRSGAGPTTDWVDCVAWTARARRSTEGWAVGDEVSVDGALRRRHYQTPVGARTRLEVEVLRGRRTARSG